MTTTKSEPKVTDFGCPVCKAVPGEPCVMRGGPKDRTAHLGRQDSFIRALNKYHYAQTELRLAKSDIIASLRESGPVPGYSLRRACSPQFFHQALGALIDAGEVVRHGERELALPGRTAVDRLG